MEGFKSPVLYRVLGGFSIFSFLYWRLCVKIAQNRKCSFFYKNAQKQPFIFMGFIARLKNTGDIKRDIKSPCNLSIMQGFNDGVLLWYMLQATERGYFSPFPWLFRAVLL